MTPEPVPVPDLLAELRAGRYPYDFVQALIGSGQAAGSRRVLLDELLRSSDGGRAVTTLLLVGARHMLDQLASHAPGSRVQSISTLAAVDDQDASLDG